MAELGVNIDHVATVREARRGREPDPVWAAVAAELGGADAITIHLREDRRHIQERDVRILRETVSVALNLELAAEPEVLRIACEVRPDQVTLVPEKREEITTEGGLDVLSQREKVRAAIAQLRAAGIAVSLFLDPDREQIDAGTEWGVDAIELHTGQYANAAGAERTRQLQTLCTAAEHIGRCGLALHAGHGLTYQNVGAVAAIANMHELNIGHSIVSRAFFVGLEAAVREMKQLVR